MANTPEVPDDQDHADDPRPQPLDRATPAYRRDLIAPMVIHRMTVRAIEQALAALPPQQRPLHRSRNVIGNDVIALRAEWRTRAADLVGSMIAEELAKLEALEQAFLPKALDEI